MSNETNMPLFIASTESMSGACVQQWTGEHYTELLSVSEYRVGGKDEALRIARHIAALLNEAPVLIDPNTKAEYDAERKRREERASRDQRFWA